MRILTSLLFALMLAFGLGQSVTAGVSSAGADALPSATTRAFANEAQLHLAQKGVRVAIVGRMARDPADLPPGIRFTHTAFWVYSQITDAKGDTAFGYRVWNLYQRAGQPQISDLVQDSPAEFLAPATRAEIGVIIPSEALQERLLATLSGPRYAAVHNPNYSLLSNPADGRFQNCTEHTLDVVMAALYETSDRVRIKRNIAAHFTPQLVELSPLMRGLGPIFVSGASFADHDGPVRTATFGSIARFLQANGMASEVMTLRPGGARPF